MHRAGLSRTNQKQLLALQEKENQPLQQQIPAAVLHLIGRLISNNQASSFSAHSNNFWTWGCNWHKLCTDISYAVGDDWQFRRDFPLLLGNFYAQFASLVIFDWIWNFDPHSLAGMRIDFQRLRLELVVHYDGSDVLRYKCITGRKHYCITVDLELSVSAIRAVGSASDEKLFFFLLSVPQALSMQLAVG